MKIEIGIRPVNANNPYIGIDFINFGTVHFVCLRAIFFFVQIDFSSLILARRWISSRCIHLNNRNSCYRCGRAWLKFILSK
jgi:hypothetical protein